MEKIRWAPKVRQARILTLYQGDARGLLDGDLTAEVGYALLARCRDILKIRDGWVACPRCGTDFLVRAAAPAESPVPCPSPGCGWETTPHNWHESFRHRELWCGKAIPAFEEYTAAFPKAHTPQERMLTIDRLLHAFHWDLEANLPNRPAANNLVEGSVEQVISLLESLTFGSDEAAKEQWRETVKMMIKRRKGQL